MKVNVLSLAIGICATVAFSQPALAEDCAAATKNAMLATAQKPVSTITTKRRMCLISR
jgi:hypothetical protein